jgi:heme-degrading monooxygenase HmoA
LQAGALPVVAREEGFQSVTFLLDRQNGKLISITVFDSEAHMRTAHEGIKGARAGVLKQLGATHMAAESFEIVASRKI